MVTGKQRQGPDSMAHRARTAPLLARRARIVLACATGPDNRVVAPEAADVGTDRGPVASAIHQSHGVDGLLDEPRPGTPRKIGRHAGRGRREHARWKVLRPGATHWSTRTLAKATGVSPMSVHRIWQAFGLQPHRTKTFKLSPDPLLIDKVRDIVGVVSQPTAACRGLLRR